MELRTFEECISEAKSSSSKCHLILGNGFSISLFPNIFNYEKLRDVVKSKGLEGFFDSFKTNDFEYVMRKILDAQEVIKVVDSTNEKLIKSLDYNYNQLANALIEAITDSHPNTPSEISDEQYDSCRKFLSNFDKKYTFNYDLILYWVHMHFLNKENSLDSNDGFGKEKPEDCNVYWEIGNEGIQNLYYLHGALHIFSDGANIEKHTWNNTGKSIINQVREMLNQKKLPIFVAEGSKEHKKERIYGNGYLARSFSSLKNIGGTLFIFGHSLRDEDDHVFNLVLKGKLKNIYVSIFGDLKNDYNKKIISKIERWQSEYSAKSFYIYDASSVKVWNNV